MKRKELLVVKIIDFSKDVDEPAFDVEIYKDGVFINVLSDTFSVRKFGLEGALREAKMFAVCVLTAKQD